MIPEAFLIATLALPGLGYIHPDHVFSEKRMPSFAEFLSKGPRFLSVGGDPIVVDNLRNTGTAAFGVLTEDRPGITPWHIVSDAGYIGFKTASFATVLWKHSNPMQDPSYTALVDAARLVEPLGKLVFIEEDYPLWISWLNRWGWKRLFKVENTVGYKKPYFGDFFFGRNLSGAKKLPYLESFLRAMGSSA